MDQALRRTRSQSLPDIIPPTPGFIARTVRDSRRRFRDWSRRAVHWGTQRGGGDGLADGEVCSPISPLSSGLRSPKQHEPSDGASDGENLQVDGSYDTFDLETGTVTSDSLHSSSTMSLKTAMEMAVPQRHDVKSLLSISDSVRSSLATHNTLGPDGKRLTNFLRGVLADEVHDSPMLLEYDVIVAARLDKLVEALVDPLNKPLERSGRHFAAITASSTLQRRWRSRFKEKYFEMDDMRTKTMLSTGRLHDVIFRFVPDEGRVVWEAKAGEEVAEFEGNMQTEAGCWWLNLACVHRDGMVGSGVERPTRGQYGTAALPLLTGSEEVAEDGMSRYTREGKQRSDMHVSLLTQVGKRIRILRGYRLKSAYAPVGGIRYDGLYIIRRYTMTLDEVTESYRLELRLERVDGQKPMERLKRIPKPSQLDDWRFYEKMEAEKIKKKEGDASYMKWSLEREAEQTERDKRRQSRDSEARVEDQLAVRRRSQVMLEIPGRRHSRFRDPKDEVSPKTGSEAEED